MRAVLLLLSVVAVTGALHSTDELLDLSKVRPIVLSEDTYLTRHVVTVAGWGLVVIAETDDGRSVAYASSSNDPKTTHTMVRHGAFTQKLISRDGVPPPKWGQVRDVRRLPDEEEPIVTDDPAPRRRRVCSPNKFTRAGKTVIRVGVLHTPEVLALRYYGGNSDIVRAEVAVAVAEANAIAFPLSGIDIEIELCVNELLPPPSVERTRPSATLTAFSRSSAVETVRQNNKCDTMVLFSTLAALGNRACGIGYLPGEHAVAAADCFVDNYSFLHELGHNLGACHGPPSRPCGAGANGYGDATSGFRSILAYRSICGGSGNCTRVPRFSNKKSEFKWRGQPIGNSLSNNAWLLNENKEGVASKVC